MDDEIKIYKALLWTEKIKIKEGQNEELYKKIYNLMNEEEAIVGECSLWGDDYHFYNLVDKEKDKELCWLFEQDDFVGIYDDRAKFDEDWESGNYERIELAFTLDYHNVFPYKCGCCTHFSRIEEDEGWCYETTEIKKEHETCRKCLNVDVESFQAAELK